MQNNKCSAEKESVEKVFSIYGMQFVSFEIPNWIVLFSFFSLSLSPLHICSLNKTAYSIIMIRIDPGEEKKKTVLVNDDRESKKTCYIVVKVERLNEI